MNPLSRFSSQIAFRSCPCNEPKKDCSVEHGKVEYFTSELKDFKYQYGIADSDFITVIKRIILIDI